MTDPFASLATDHRRRLREAWATALASRRRLRVAQHDPQAWHNLAGSMWTLGDLAAATWAFEQVRALAPSTPFAVHHLGCVYQLREMHEKALSCHGEAYRLSPHPYVALAYANALEMFGCGAEAERIRGSLDAPALQPLRLVPRKP